MTELPHGVSVRRDAGLYGYERTLMRAGLGPVAGADEAGRGACAGPLVAAAVVLPAGASRIAGLADSKLLTPAARERVYAEVVSKALAWEAVVISAAEIDRSGLHRCNLAAMRRALARLTVRPSFVLTDGFTVAGLGRPGLAIWKGDQVAACVAAASVVAKVTRDRIMTRLHDTYPKYRFDEHKGYVTAAHQAALTAHGPCPEHRRSYANVVAVGDVVADSFEPVAEVIEATDESTCDTDASLLAVGEAPDVGQNESSDVQERVAATLAAGARTS